LNLVWNLNGLIVKFTVQKPEILIKNVGVMLIEDVKKKCGNVLVSALVNSFSTDSNQIIFTSFIWTMSRLC
jgi:hypothetical protein